MKDKLTLKKILNFEIITIIVILIVVTTLSVFIIDIENVKTMEDLKNSYKEVFVLELYIFIVVNIFGIANVIDKMVRAAVNKSIVKRKNEEELVIDRPTYSVVIMDVLLNKMLDSEKILEHIKENQKNEVPSYMNINSQDEFYYRMINLDFRTDEGCEKRTELEIEIYNKLNELGFIKEAPTFIRLNNLKEVSNIIYFGTILVLTHLLFLGEITAFGIIPIIAYLVFTVKTVRLSKMGAVEESKIRLYNQSEKEEK